MGDLDDVPTFTALTYEGYKQYADLLRTYLPKSQEPRIAPVGLAFLLVWEENYSFWERMFHTGKGVAAFLSEATCNMYKLLSQIIVVSNICRFYTCITAWDIPSGFGGTSHTVWCHATMGRRRSQRSVVFVEACAPLSTF